MITNEVEYKKALEEIEHIWDTYDDLGLDVSENKDFLPLVLMVEEYEKQTEEW